MRILVENKIGVIWKEFKKCVASHISKMKLHFIASQHLFIVNSSFHLLVSFFSDVSQKCHAIIFRNMNARLGNDHKPNVFSQGYQLAGSPAGSGEGTIFLRSSTSILSESRSIRLFLIKNIRQPVGGIYFLRY